MLQNVTISRVEMKWAKSTNYKNKSEKTVTFFIIYGGKLKVPE